MKVEHPAKSEIGGDDNHCRHLSVNRWSSTQGCLRERRISCVVTLIADVYPAWARSAIAPGSLCQVSLPIVDVWAPFDACSSKPHIHQDLASRAV